MDLARWLQQQGLAQLEPKLREAGIDLDVLGDLESADLAEIGLSLGDRKRLLKAIDSAPPSSPSGVVRKPAATPAQTPSLAAERRQLTVMFCDLVGSTALSSRLDPEDLRRVIGEYHQTVAAAVSPYDGYVAQLLGDGVLVYFGYPRAHEDDADRAVRAALAALSAVAKLNPHGGLRQQSRIGIATGEIVVGEIGAGTPAADLAASGKTPNLAARLQAEARPGEVVLSEGTRQLIGDFFNLEPLGALDLKGFAAPVQAWRVLSERTPSSRFEAQHIRGLVEFIGRDTEVALLLDRWALSREGEGQAVLLSGEAGIGKSRICQTLRERLASESVATVLLQCSPYFTSSALYPIVQHLERAAGMATADLPEVRGQKLEQLASALPSMSVGCLLRLISLPDGGRPKPGGGSPQEEKTHTLEALTEMLQRLAQQQPVLFLIEDAHWIDPSTEEFIAQIAQRIDDIRILLLATCRPEYSPSWGGASRLTRYSLNRLSHKQSGALVNAVTGGKPLPLEVLTEIIRKTEGIPLFIEELTKTVVQSGLLEDTATGYQLRGPLPQLAIPATLQDSLMARLDRLASAKEVAQVGAVIGREFGHQLITQVMCDMPPSKLEASLADLVQSELVFRRGTPPDATYSFKHALIRDTAYNSILKGQRVLRHRQIAASLEIKVDTAATEPALLAYHHQEGGNATAAARYWQAAGDQAMARSAAREAVTHFLAAIGQLAAVPENGELAEFELGLRIRTANALFESEGFNSPLAQESYTKARDLAALLDRPDQHMQASAGMAVGLYASGQLQEAIAMLERFTPGELERVKPMGRVSRLVRMGIPTMLGGKLELATSYFNEARREFAGVMPNDWQPLGGVDPLVAMVVLLSHSLAFQGLLTSAEACAREGLQIAEQRQHANSQLWSLCKLSSLCICKRDWPEAIAFATRGLEIAERYTLNVYGGIVRINLGCALVSIGRIDEGMRHIREGYDARATFGGRFYRTMYAADAAEALLDARKSDEALEYILAGEKAQEETDERFQAARFLVMRGRLAEKDGDRIAAEAAFREAIQVANEQGALLYSLRAATALAYLCVQLGRSPEVDGTLRPIYDRFTEGFDYPDLVRARIAIQNPAK